MHVRIFSRAKADIVAALSWWEANRPAAPARLEEELAAALRQVEAQPFSAPPAKQTQLKSFRRLSLVETRYHLYYRVDEKKQQVSVLRLWHMSRRRAPKL